MSKSEMAADDGFKHNSLRPSQALSLLQVLVPAHETCLLTGPPGVGKSDLLRQTGKATGHDLIVMHPSISDPTKFEGLPFPAEDRESAIFLPYGELYHILNAKRETLVVLEDFGQATVAVQAACMQLLHSATGERRLGSRIVPECISFALTSNRRRDKAGVQGILETVKSRCSTIIDVVPTLDDWKGWAAKNDVAPEVIGFLNFRRELFHQFEATADLTNSPSPRTWAALSRLYKLNLPSGTRLQVFSGTVGDGAASEFMNYLETIEEAPNIEDILRDPMKAPIPPMDKPGLLYAVASGLAHAATQKTMKSVAAYATRLFESNLGEFSTLIMVDAIRRDPELHKNQYYRAWAVSKAGDDLVESRHIT